MLEAALVALRFVQYGGAAILLGTSLFFLYALPRTGPGAAAERNWPRRVVACGAAALLVASLLGLVVQTAAMAGSWAEGLKPSSLAFVVSEMELGRSSLVRASAAALGLAAVLVIKPGPRLWAGLSALGAAACVSFAWMGHAGASEGPAAFVHLVGDMLHALAAAIWVGALVAFAILVSGRQKPDGSQQTLARALRGFSSVGSGLVAVLIVTGLTNSWFLVGPAGLQGLWTTPYGQVLAAKLLVFLAMLGLAGANRFRLAPAISGPGASPAGFAALRRSLFLETLAAFAALALVAWLGTLAPISSL